MAEIKSKSEYQRALDSMTRYLALRDHSRGELRAKLERRYDALLVEKLLSEADDHGWLVSDESVADRAVAAFARKNKSRRYIEAQLRKRHLPVPASLKSNSPLSYDDEDGEGRPQDRNLSGGEIDLNSARALVEKKFGEAKSLSFEEKGKASRFLAYRGFDSRTIRRVLNGE